MKNFTEIDTELLEGILDKTTSKVKDVKKLSKELLKRQKDLEKIDRAKYFVSELWSASDSKLKKGEKGRDLVGNEIKFGDFVMWAEFGGLGQGNLDFGFVIDVMDDGKCRVIYSPYRIDVEQENPFEECSWGDVWSHYTLVLSRLNDVKTIEKVMRNLYK